VYLIEAPTPFNLEELDIGGSTKEVQQEVRNLLEEYSGSFANSISQIGTAKDVEMTIRLTDDVPFSCRPYRMTTAEQQTTKDMVDELLKCGIIRETNAPYASPVVLVKKKTNDIRMCIDYRKLNAKTVRNNYPLPRIDEMVDRLAGSKVFHILDLKSGYYQIPMAEESKGLTAFVTPNGQFEFNKMPFGLTNAPSVSTLYASSPQTCE